MSEMTMEDFWQKWMPCDRPAITPSAAEKREFMRDLAAVVRPFVKNATATTRRRCLPQPGSTTK